MLSFNQLVLAGLFAISSASSPTARTIATLPLGTWIENVAARPNGNLLVTTTTPHALVYEIVDPAALHPVLQLKGNATTLTSFLGITHVDTHDEYETYVIIGGLESSLAVPVPGTTELYTLQYKKAHAQAKSAPSLKKLGDFPDAKFYNGLTSVAGLSNVVLVGDSAVGQVDYFNIKTQEYLPGLFSYPEMKPNPDAAAQYGVNGLKTLGNFLYWSNSNYVTIYRVELDIETGHPCTGAQPQLVANLTSIATFLDDFAFDQAGNILVASNFDNTLIRVDAKSGKSSIIAGNEKSLLLAGDTAVAFDGNPLIAYVTTTGAISNPVNGTETRNATVVAISI